MEVFTTDSPEETKKLARQILKKLKTNTIGLIGDLGSGKTTFVQGLAEGLGIKKRVISPSFVLIRQYKIPPPRSRFATPRRWRLTTPPRWNNLYHIDLYRLEGKIDIVSLGLKEIWGNKANFVIIEWAEKIKEQWPENCLIVEFENLGGNRRKLKIKDKKQKTQT